MKKINCLLVDDEPPALELLGKYASMTDQVEVVGTSLSAVKAFDLLSKEQVDLMFLDIQMPVLNGIDFLKTLKHPPAIIMTTAYREYALDGYDLDIIDYLLKPIPFERFLKAIERFKIRQTVPSLPASEATKALDYFFCKVNRSQHKVFFNKILYVESLKDYVRIHTVEEKLVVKGNLGTYMKILPTEKFTRIHRSYAVANEYISAYNSREVRIGKINLPLGSSYREKFHRLMSRD